MAKRHDRQKDLAALAKKGVKVVNNYLQIPKNTLGIKSWGRVDYLVNHGGFYGYVLTKS